MNKIQPKKNRICIVGAGPIGTYLGHLLASEGFDVNIFDQKKKIGVPMQCTGILTSSIEKLIKIPDKIILNRVKNVTVSCGKAKAKISLDDIVIDRIEFDKHLATIAKKSGAKIFLQHRFVSLDEEKKRIYVKSLKNNGISEFNYDFLIGSDGPNSLIAKYLNPNKKREYYLGMQSRIDLSDFEKSAKSYDVFFGKFCPDFFAWSVPENSEVYRIGLASQIDVKKRYEKFISGFQKKGEKNKPIIDSQGGQIPIYDPFLKLCNKNNNIFIVGDSAGFVKATTGGGIVQGIIGSKCLHEAISKNKSYVSLINKSLRKELIISLIARKILNRFKDRDYSDLINMIAEEKIRRILYENSRDKPTILIIKLLFKKPSLIKFIRVLMRT